MTINIKFYGGEFNSTEWNKTLQVYIVIESCQQNSTILSKSKWNVLFCISKFCSGSLTLSKNDFGSSHHGKFQWVNKTCLWMKSFTCAIMKCRNSMSKLLIAFFHLFKSCQVLCNYDLSCFLQKLKFEIALECIIGLFSWVVWTDLSIRLWMTNFN